MTINLIEVGGLKAALKAMRLPMDSGKKSDTVIIQEDGVSNYQAIVGPVDKDLSMRLQKAGPEHCKHLLQVVAWLDIKCPRQWWIEFDTYRFGVEKVSCSTMHTLMRRPISADDFEHDCMNDDYLNYVIENINYSMDEWRSEKDENEKKKIWRSIIEALPQSYLQERVVMVSYAALRNIVRQREGHKLHEWAQFIEFCKTLPESWMIFE